MRSFEPILPSIAFVLAQAQAQAGGKPHAQQPVRSRKHPKKSKPHFSPHLPRYPPQLNEDYLMKTVDYRYIEPPRPVRSSFALVCWLNPPTCAHRLTVCSSTPKSDIFSGDDKAEIEISDPTTASEDFKMPTSTTLPTTTAFRVQKVKKVYTYVVVGLESLTSDPNTPVY
ncbi:hypothetical protein EW146_g6571 [Bondarzewia mesenterica]|uniref:Uncharacterized protein n=1 Tax=Bondarzewia mesenterica TaxID=1095465 RepID=A0A4S4LN64_9AGAM|nr:hypothetical protein EW146_g6571 [Bondarzewia mesenterica]